MTRRKVGTVFAVALTTFLASAVGAIEMVAIVTGVGATRGWRSALAGAAAGGVAAVVVAGALGLASSRRPAGSCAAYCSWWVIAAAVALSLAADYALLRAGHRVWWLVPVAVIAVMTFSLWRARDKQA